MSKTETPKDSPCGHSVASAAERQRTPYLRLPTNVHPPAAWSRTKGGYRTLLAALDRLRTARNDAAHGTRIPSPTAAERWLARVQDHWSRAREQSRPYTSCRLFLAESLLAHTDSGEPVHQLRWLAGNLLYPRAERCAWPVRLRLGRLYVLRAGLVRPSSPDDILDVSTFLGWEHSSVLDRPEAYGVVGLGEDVLEFGAFGSPDERALDGRVPEWLATR